MTTTQNQQIKHLLIFENGLHSELQALKLRKNELKKKENEFIAGQHSVTDSLVKKLLSLIPDYEKEKEILQKVVDKKSLLFELVEACLDYKTESHKKAQICRSYFYLGSDLDKKTKDSLIKKINLLGKHFAKLAKFSCNCSQTGICFKLSFN